MLSIGEKKENVPRQKQPPFGSFSSPLVALRMACINVSRSLTCLLFGGQGCCLPFPLLFETVLGGLPGDFIRSEGSDDDPLGLVQGVRCILT